MKCYHSLEELAQDESGFGLALGVFDGVHLGHQAVISAAGGQGRTGVLTFEPHPVQVLAPSRAPRRILASQGHKARILADLGVDFLVVMDFTQEFAKQEAEIFVQALLETGVKKLSAGEDWCFGKGRRGTMARLAEWCAGVEVAPVAPVMSGGERISSTRIRQCLRDGNVLGAAQMLGREYAVQGEVKEGRQLGRTIGFPTANVAVSEEQLPGDGVYAIRGCWGGAWCPGVANVGVKPTVEQGLERSLEAYFFSNTVPDRYGWEVEIGFTEKLREEMEFTSVEDLKKQITRDVEAASGVHREKS